MADKINLDPETIVNKKFRVDFKGYDPSEVDKMLDEVIEDYETYAAMVESLNSKIIDLENTNESLRSRLVEMEGIQKAMEEDGDPMMQGANNIDILKRLTRLENEVFKGSTNRKH